jgi:hypothetical protein
MEHAEEPQDGIHATAELIAPIADKLRKLPKDEIEELVLFLKNPHVPEKVLLENWDKDMEFVRRVEELRNIPEQVHLQRQALKAIRWSITCGVFIGICSTVGALMYVGTGGWIVPAILMGFILFLYWKAEKLGIKAILISKEQDQRHLLASIRKATSVNELNKAGLFAWSNDAGDMMSKNYNTDEAKAALMKQVAHLRDAIYRNPDEGRLQQYLEGYYPE